jgi:DNA-binding MarR family transcriptional regulator
VVGEDLVQDERITAVGLLNEMFAGLTTQFATQIGEHGLALVEFEVLIRLARSPECRLRMTDLSTQTSLTTSGVTRVVDRLERDGLVCRTACPTDRRSSYAVLTDAGRERLAAVLPGHLAMIDRWFTDLLTPDQLATMLTGMRVIRDAVRPGATAGVPPTEAAEESSTTAAGTPGTDTSED